MAEKKEKKEKSEKYPKEETTPYNPWAVCHTTVDKDKDPEKYERCVKKVKEQNKERNEKKEKAASAEDKLMKKVAGLMEDAGVFTGGQEPLPSEQAAILRNAAIGYQQQLQNFLQALMDLPSDPALDVRINKIQAAISRAMELAGI